MVTAVNLFQKPVRQHSSFSSVLLEIHRVGLILPVYLYTCCLCVLLPQSVCTDPSSYGLVPWAGGAGGPLAEDFMEVWGDSPGIAQTGAHPGP